MKIFVIKLNKSLLIRIVPFSVFFLYNCIFEVNAATINAASCSQIDVQAAIDTASDGDTVVVPAESCTWTSGAENSPSVSISGKAITLQGAGMNNTIITDGTDTRSRQVPLSVSGTEGKPCRVTGFTFIGPGSSDSEAEIKVSGKDWRIDHCKFNNSGEIRAIKAWGNGVIDHCTIVDSKQGVAVLGDGDASWEAPLTLGSADAVYIEDCTFDYDGPYDGALDAYGGARYVFRYNTVLNTHAGHHGRDTGGYRSVHSFEYYENTFTKIGGTGQRGLFFRGGTGVVFNNTWTSDGAGWQSYGCIQVSNYCSCPEQLSCGWEPCTEYPCIDQIGRSTDSDNDDIQDLEPLYEWNNTNNGEDQDICIHNVCSSMGEHIQENRDYYNDTQRPGYSPYTYPHPLVTDDIEYEIIVNAYPNPCRVYRGENIITFSGDLISGDIIEIYDINGKLIHNSGNLSEATYEWSVSDIASGVFFFVVKSADGETKASGKFAVIR
ncbi:T9SS type A sorting domain-containing protein [candidate division WOR-3 bacterium]|nr:T9SS type A sorting domain-containing protein [candidate division WOR-3 bacterium]